MTGHVLIAGASGVIGRPAVAHFLSKGWQVTALSRREPGIAGVRHMSVDLTNSRTVATALAALEPVTHVVYAAVHEEPNLVAGWRSEQQMQTNLEMLRNLLDPLSCTGGLRHVSLFQGTKAYGVHVRPFPVPARENWPRHKHANFYWLQEDFLRDLAARRGFDFTIWRPQIVFGDAVGVAMNITPVLGAYAALEAAAGRGAAYPGGPGYVIEATDARLIARALTWATHADAARGETFNITNGDVFTWPNIWPTLCDAFDVEQAPPKPTSLAADLPDRAAEWERLACDRDLALTDIHALVGHSHHYADFVMATGAERTPAPVLVSTIKLRQAGFHDCINTETMFREQIAELQGAGVLPASGTS